MKDFAGSSITYYGLAREKLMNKYPRLISVLIILALICTTGLAIFLISDLVSFASNPDYKGVLVGLDLKGPENGIAPMTDGKEKSGNIGANSSLENTSSQTKMNASLPSSQTAKGVVATGKSSSSSSQSSVNKKSGNSPVIRHHSSSSSSSSKSSSANSAKKSSDKNNLTNETGKDHCANKSIDEQFSRTRICIGKCYQQCESTSDGCYKEPITSSNRSNDSEVAPTAILTSLPSVAVGSITNPAKDTPAREPVSIIKFKTASPSARNRNRA